MGQYLGFILLIVMSLGGFFGSFLIPAHLVKLLGLIPLCLGIIALTQDETSEFQSVEEMLPETPPSSTMQWLSPQIYTVASVTVANGSDNISIYVPLFAHNSGQNLIITLIIFLILVSVWCFAAYRLTRLPVIADLLHRQGNRFVPCVLITLGVYIVKESLLLTLLSLIISYLWTISLNSPNLSPKD